MKLVWIAALLLVGCAKDPISSTRTPNSNVRADLLTVIDGCNIWRFYDVGEYRYFARCSDGAIGVSQKVQRNCGKNCTESVEASTIGDGP